MARRVVVEFVAELTRFRRETREAADDIRKLKDEAEQAQSELADLGTAADRAAQDVADSSPAFAAAGAQSGRAYADGFTRDATGRLRDAKGRFVAAGSDAGDGFGDGFTRDAQGRLRDARGRFVAEGRRLGDAAGQGATDSISKALSKISPIPFLGLAGGAVAAAAGLQGIPPILAAIGGGLASIPALAAGALAALGTLSLGTMGLGDAIGEVFNPPARGGGGGGGGGGGPDRTAANLRALEAAERNLSRAQRDSRLAQEEVTRARRAATRELRDMSIALGRAALDERDADLAVREAERDLRELQAEALKDPKSVSDLELERAQLTLEQTKQSVTEVSTAAQDLREDQAEAARAGVEGSERVQSALRAQADAADAVIDATDGVKAAQEAMAVAAASGGGGGGVARQATAYDRLSKNAKAVVDVIRDYRDELIGIQQLAQDRVFAGIDTELRETAEVLLPFARRQVIRFGDTWNETFRQLARVSRDQQFLTGLDDALAVSDRFFDGVNRRIPGTARSLSHLFTGSIPFIDQFGDALLGKVDKFNDMINRAAADGSLDRFFRDAANQAEALLDIGEEVLQLFGRYATSQQGSTLLRDWADALERFNDSAQAAEDVAAVIETGNVAIEGTVDVLMILGEALANTLADPGTRDAIELFFDVLRIGAEVVAELVEAFSALPDWLQATVLAGIALGGLAGRLFGAMGRLRDVTDAVAGRLGAMGPAGTRAGRGLQHAADWAGRAATAFIALQVAAVVLDQFDDSAVKVDALNRSLRELAVTGQVGGELARQFGTDLDELSKVAGAAGDGAVPRLGRAIEGLLPPVRSLSEIFSGGSFTGSRERFEELDNQLRAVGESTGDLEGVTRAYNKILAESGLNVFELNKLLPETAAWLKEQQAQAHGVNRSQEILNGTMDEAIRKTGSYTQAWKVLHGEQLQTDEILLAAVEAIDRVGESFERNGNAVEGNTRAALENRIAVANAGAAAAAAAQSKYEETHSVEAATAVYDEHIAKLREELRAAGLTKSQIDQLVQSYTTMPPINVVSTSLETATQRAQRLNAELNKIVSKSTIRIGVEGGRGGFIERWGGIIQHAQTGLVNLRQAGVYSPTSPAQYAFAEPGTGGEAFIPRFGDPERSVNIGRQAMEWYGYDVIHKDTLRQVWGAAMQIASQPPQAGDQITNQYYFQPQKAVADERDFERFQQRQDSRARINRPR